jgi:hypothetical protein
MEKTVADIEADVAARARARTWGGHALIAEKLIDLVTDLEAKLAAFVQSRALNLNPSSR